MEVEAITPIHDENEESNDTTVEISSDNSEEVNEAATESNSDNAESSEAPIEIPATEVEESVKNTPKVTQQAEALKAALRRAQANQKTGKNPQNKKSPAVDDRRRTMLLGKKATRTIKADNGDIIVENGSEITEEVLQKAKLANKYIELSMNYSH